MTAKERIKAAVNSEPVDRLPFWPKLDKAYSNKWGGKASDYHEYIGSDYISGICCSFKEIHKNTWQTNKNSGDDNITVFGTPHGELRMIKHFDEKSQSSHPVEHPIKSKEDMEILTYWFKDALVDFDPEGNEKAIRQYNSIGEKAYTVDNIGKSPLMYFIEWLAGVERGHYLLADYPDETEELFDAMQQNLVKKFEISAEYSPADSLHLTENTSTTIISPSQYEQYCFPHISECGNIARESGKKLMLHMCGHLKLILPTLNKLPVSSFEAFTSPPVGNTTLQDGREACPDKCLIGGTNATVWLEEYDKIIEYMEQSLEALPHHRGIFMSSAGVMPPMCKPETIKNVKSWLDNYKLRL